MQYIHKVKKEESVRDICVKYSVCEEELLSANNLAEEDIKEGVLLFVSVPDGRRYVVKPFDTIRKIAEKFEVSEAAILEFNNIKQIFLGQIIYIPWLYVFVFYATTIKAFWYIEDSLVICFSVEVDMEKKMKFGKEDLIDIVKSSLIAVVSSLVLILLFAIIIKFSGIADNVILAINMVIKSISIVLGILFGIKHARLGAIKGLFSGLLFVIVSYVLFSIINLDGKIDLMMLVDSLIILAESLISGIIAVNIKDKRTGKRWTQVWKGSCESKFTGNWKSITAFAK